MSEPVILLPRYDSYLQQGLSRELTPIVKVFMPGIIPKLKLIWHNMLYKVKTEQELGRNKSNVLLKVGEKKESRITLL